MNKAIRQSVCESFTRMKQRRKAREAANIMPEVPCGNCGDHFWQLDADGFWSCFLCGNRGIWQDGSFIQTSKGNP